MLSSKHLQFPNPEAKEEGEKKKKKKKKQFQQLKLLLKAYRANKLSGEQ